LRPQPHEAFLRLQVFPAEQAQVDWAYFGSVMVGRAKRQLSCFVITLSWSRASYLEFFPGQTTKNFRAAMCAFSSLVWSALGGHPVRQPEKPYWKRRGIRFISTHGCWNWRLTITSCHVRASKQVRPVREIRTLGAMSTCGKSRSGTARSGPPAPPDYIQASHDLMHCQSLPEPCP
jgi:hypothetical protein